MRWKARIFAVLMGGFFFQSQGLAATISFAVIGDAGKYNSNTKAVHQSIARSGLTRLILPGDNLYSGTYAQQWSPWSGFDFSVVAIGNHNDGYQNEIRYFGMPGEYYAKEVGGVRFLVLNSDNTRTVEQQADWLEGELKKAPAGQATFLVWHHPPYTVTTFHNWKEKAAFQTRMRALLKQHSERITGLLVGHDHIGAVYCLDSMPMMVSGAIWDTRRPEQKSYKDATDGTQVTPQWIFPEGTPVWGRLDVELETGSSTVRFIRASDDKVLHEAVWESAGERVLCAS